MLILGINIILISTITSFFQCNISFISKWNIGGCNSHNRQLYTIYYIYYPKIWGSFAKIVKAILFIWPNLYQIQRQAGNILFSKNIEIRPI